jgi:K+-transporting ATPase ATPase C chain
MLSQVRPAILFTITFTLLTGVVYPLATTALAHLLFPHQSQGSLLRRGEHTVGSELIGQEFTGGGYFWGRPSATLPPYNGGASTGSNLGPSNPALAERVAASVTALREAHGRAAAIPVDLATASGSGLDPHISPAAALYQVERVAKARGLAEATVRRLIEEQIEGRQFGFLGEPRVNVLRLNLSLDEMKGRTVR